MISVYLLLDYFGIMRVKIIYILGILTLGH